VLVALTSPFFGMSVITPAALFDAGSPDFELFWRLRLPRVVLAFLSGAGLAVSGMVFQALFRNPLATPFTLGVSSGAALGASLYFRLGAGVTVLGSLGSIGAALTGGLISVATVYLITRAKGGFSTPVMLLAGVIINFFFSSLVMFIQYLSSTQDSMRILHWLMGSLSGIEIPRLPDLAFVVIVGALCIGRITQEIDLLTAGEDIAASRGVRVGQTKLIIFLAASAMVGTIVSMAGPISFVGMMVPQICRILFGWSHRRLLPVVFFMGGAFLILCDLAARTLLAPAELPIGIITALLGGPFFLWTLFRAGRNDELF
jgi:iron complex transport system permease protein